MHSWIIGNMSRPASKTCCSINMVPDFGGLNEDALITAKTDKNSLKQKQQGSGSDGHWGDKVQPGTQST